MTEFPYVIVDVFADAPLHGNPLAVVFDADGLSGAQMAALGREFNLSETAFILKPRDPAHTAQVRIFTPMEEVPFAGHPNIGAAFALARHAKLPSDDLAFDELAGLVRLRLMRESGAIVGASLQAPQPLTTQPAPGAEVFAAALSITLQDVVTTTHEPLIATVGLPFAFVELESLEALGRIRVHLPAFDKVRDRGILAIHAYVKEPTSTGYRIQARNLSPYDGIIEDPATGSANASLAALLAERDPRADCEIALDVKQGVEMGRSSLLHASAEKRGGKVAPPFVSGRCAQVMQGTLTL
ncbi:MAG TPA: PhzF family phenazine biosynthesis protein [Dongiaceae bacterium]|nr:PhzF family phenazine biosynthesis protein [Dongiaceae bacterium]